LPITPAEQNRYPALPLNIRISQETLHNKFAKLQYYPGDNPR